MNKDYSQIALFLFCFLLSTNGQSTNTPIVSIVNNSSGQNLIEDQKITFACQVHDDSKGVDWFIRDPISKLETSLENTLDQRKRRLVINSISHFQTVIRREFERMEVVCQTPSGDEGSLLLPQIEKILPIEEVKYLSKDLVRGQKLKLECDVKSPPNVVKKVFFRSFREIAEATNNISLGNGTNRYEFRSNLRINMMDHNNMPMQCFASVSKKRSAKGIVASKVTKITVHYLQFLSGSFDKKNVTKGSLVNVSFLIDANPKPHARNFNVLQLPPKSNEFFKKQMAIIQKGGTKYAVKSQFPTEKALNYVFRYSTLFRNDSRPLFINVTYLELEEFRKWKSRTIPRHTSLELHFLIFANPFPLAKEIIFRLRHKTHSGYQYRTVKEVEHMQKVDDYTYLVVLRISPMSSGSYQLLVNAKNMSDKGSVFQIHLSDPSSVSRKTLVISISLAVFCIVFLATIVAVLIWKYSAIVKSLMSKFSVTVTSYVTSSEGFERSFRVCGDDFVETFIRQIDREMKEKLHLRPRMQIAVHGTDQNIYRSDAHSSKEEGKKLKDFGICENAKIVLKSFDSIEIRIIAPNLVDFETKTVELTGNTCEWKEIKREVIDKLQLESLSFVYQRAFVHRKDGKLRYGIATEGNRDRDEEDASPLGDKEKQLVVCLDEKSLVRFAPSRCPVIFIRPEGDFYVIGDDGQLRKSEGDSNPFKDLLFCGYVSGIRSDADDIEKMFFDSAEGPMFNCFQKEIVPDGKSFVEDSANRWRMFYIFLETEKTKGNERRIKLPTPVKRKGVNRNSSHLDPKKIADGKRSVCLHRNPYSIRLHCRNDCSFDVDNDGDVIIKKRAPLDSDWYSSRHAEDAVEKFTRDFFRMNHFREEK